MILPEKRGMHVATSALLGVAPVMRGLWFGQHQRGRRTLELLGIDIIAVVATELLPVGPTYGFGRTIETLPLVDGPLPKGDLEGVVRLSNRLASEIETHDRTVLVSCQAGLNRSALVAAFTAIALGARDAARPERFATQRQGALSNRHFGDAVRRRLSQTEKGIQ